MVETLLMATLFIFIFIIIIWIAYLITNNPSIIDGCWSLGIALCASIFLLKQTAIFDFSKKQLISFVLMLFWAGRLSGYIWLTRITKNKHDPRYEAISKGWEINKKVGFLLNYLFQGFLMLLVSLPFLFIGSSKVDIVYTKDLLAAALIFAAIVGESIADWQLLKFKKSLLPNKICEVGLWNYSRHPNYFFENLVWLGFALIAINGSYANYISLVSPLLLFGIFTFITGPITERQMLLSKGHTFKTYQQKTSFLIPWFKKK